MILFLSLIENQILVAIEPNILCLLIILYAVAHVVDGTLLTPPGAGSTSPPTSYFDSLRLMPGTVV